MNLDNLEEAEFHAFGPWILNITKKHPIPPLFLPYYKENQVPLMLIKVPRDVDRKNASPGMDLYDYVIGLYENSIYILYRNEKSVQETRLSYDEIEGVENFINLLIGRLTIYLKDRKIIINYNSVSEDIIINLIDIIRSKYCKKSYKNNLKELKENLNLEVLYTNLLNKMEASGDKVKITAVQPTIKVKSENQSFLQSLLNIILDKRLLSSVHLYNNKEIIILNRGTSYKSRREVVYSFSKYYICMEKIQSIEILKDETYTNVQKLNIKTNGHSFMFYIDNNNKTAIDFYKNLMNSL